MDIIPVDLQNLRSNMHSCHPCIYFWKRICAMKKNLVAAFHSQCHSCSDDCCKMQKPFVSTNIFHGKFLVITSLWHSVNAESLTLTVIVGIAVQPLFWTVCHVSGSWLPRYHQESDGLCDDASEGRPSGVPDGERRRCRLWAHDQQLHDLQRQEHDILPSCSETSEPGWTS